MPAYRFATGKSRAYHLDVQIDFPARICVRSVEGQNAGQAQASGLSYDLNATLERRNGSITTHVSAGRADNFYLFREPVVHLVVNGNEQTARPTKCRRHWRKGSWWNSVPKGKVMGLVSGAAGRKVFPGLCPDTLLACPAICSAGRFSGRVWLMDHHGSGQKWSLSWRAIELQKVRSADIPDCWRSRKTKLRYLPASATLTGENLPGKSEARRKSNSQNGF